VDAARESRVVSIFPVRRWKGTDGRLRKRTN
jgi:hypothetical protein